MRCYYYKHSPHQYGFLLSNGLAAKKKTHGTKLKISLSPTVTASPQGEAFYIIPKYLHSPTITSDIEKPNITPNIDSFTECIFASTLL